MNQGYVPIPKLKHNPKGAGRKKKFSTEELEKIFDFYMVDEFKGKVNGNKLAQYAIRHLGYGEEDIKYYHFTQNKKIIGLIDDANKERKRKFASDSILSFQNINVQSFVNKYGNNLVKLTEKLCDLQSGQLAMYNQMIVLDKKVSNLKDKLKECNEELEDIKSEKDFLKHENLTLSENLNIAKKVINVDNQIKMLQYLWNNTNIEPNNMYDQYSFILHKCGIVKSEDSINIERNLYLENEVKDLKGEIINIKSELKSKKGEDYYKSYIGDFENSKDKEFENDISLDKLESLIYGCNDKDL